MRFSLDTSTGSHVVCLFCEMTTCSNTTAEQAWIKLIMLCSYLVT